MKTTKLLRGILLASLAIATAALLGAVEKDEKKTGALTLRWYGQSFFLLTSSGDTRIAIDPFGKETGYRLVEVEADAVTVSHEHGDHNNVSLVKGRGGSSPQVFRGTRNNLQDWVEIPRGTGVRDVALHSVGVYHDDMEGKKIGKNAAFVYEADGLRLVHLGDLGHQLSKKQIGEIGKVDVVMVPVGGTYTIDADGAERVLGQLEPKLVIIPMHYKTPLLRFNLSGIEPFLKGKGNVKRVDSTTLTLKKGELPPKPLVFVLRYE